MAYNILSLLFLPPEQNNRCTHNVLNVGMSLNRQVNDLTYNCHIIIIMQMVTMVLPLKIMHVHMGSATHSHTFPDQPFVTGSCHSRSPAIDIGDLGMCLSASNPPQIERTCMSTYREQLIQCHYLCSVNIAVPHQTICIYHIRMMRPPRYSNDSYEISIRA